MLCIFTLQGLDVSSICGEKKTVWLVLSAIFCTFKKRVSVFCDKKKHLEYRTYARKNLVLINNDIKGQAVSAGWKELNGLLGEKTLRYSLNILYFLSSSFFVFWGEDSTAFYCKNAFIFWDSLVPRRNKPSLYLESTCLDKQTRKGGLLQYFLV